MSENSEVEKVCLIYGVTDEHLSNHQPTQMKFFFFKKKKNVRAIRQCPKNPNDLFLQPCL